MLVYLSFMWYELKGSRVYGICAIIFKGYRGLWFRDNVVRSKSEEG
jgi:hypothetical protein